MSKKKYYIVYKTTNLINNKIYIGVHGQDLPPNEFDGYLGSGKVLLNSVLKYGKENFIRETLFFYKKEMEAYRKEESLVTLDFTLKETNYNMIPGGKDALIIFHSKGIQDRSIETRKKKYGSGAGAMHTEEIRSKINKSKVEKYGNKAGILITPESQEKAVLSKIAKYGNPVGPAASKSIRLKAGLSQRKNFYKKIIKEIPELDKKILIKNYDNERVVWNSYLRNFKKSLQDPHTLYKSFREVKKLLHFLSGNSRLSYFKLDGIKYTAEYQE